MATKTKTVTLDDVLAAVGDVGGKVDKLDARVAGLETRVTVIEGRQSAAPRPQTVTPPPAQATQAAPPPGAPATAPQPETQYAERQWGTCAQIGITKTRSLGRWKINFYLYGERKPASTYASAANELMNFLGEVFPEISKEHFAENRFLELNAELRKTNPNGVHEDKFNMQPFAVEWFDTPKKAVKFSDGSVKMSSFRYAERVRPL